MKLGRHLPPDYRAGTLTTCPAAGGDLEVAQRADPEPHRCGNPLRLAAGCDGPVGSDDDLALAPVTTGWQSAPAGTPVTRTSSSLPHGMAA